MTDTKPTKEEEKKKESSSQAQMTHLFSYQGPRGQEIRLHDAEFLDKHYFDFRFYEKGNRGMFPKERGIRLGFREVEFLQDAVARWKAFHKESGESGSSGQAEKVFPVTGGESGG